MCNQEDGVADVQCTFGIHISGSSTLMGMLVNLGPEGIVPSAPVFGEYPPVYTKSVTWNERPSLALQAEIANSALKEM